MDSLRESSKKEQIKKICWYMPIILTGLSIIPYLGLGENASPNVIVFTYSIGFLLSIVSIVLVYMPRTTEKNITLARIFLLIAIDTGLFNLSLIGIKKPIYEVGVVFFLSVISCIWGYFYSRKKKYKEDGRTEIINVSFLTAVSCIGIFGVRVIAAFISQDALAIFAAMLLSSTIIALNYGCGILIYEYMQQKEKGKKY